VVTGPYPPLLSGNSKKGEEKKESSKGAIVLPQRKRSQWAPLGVLSFRKVFRWVSAFSIVIEGERGRVHVKTVFYGGG